MDLSADEEPQAKLDEWVSAHAALPIDLTRRCFETALLKLTDHRFVWYLVQHHINSDAASVSILFRRVADCYARSIAGELDGVGQYPPFSDYLAFERKRTGSSRYAKSDAYWSAKLADLRDPVVPVVGGAPGAKPAKMDQERIRVELGKELSSSIRMLGTRDGIRSTSQDLTVFSIFATVLFAYLHRISGSRRIAIGVPWQNRPKQFGETAGLLMEQDPFHVTIDEDETFESLIRKVQAEALEVMRHLPYAAGNPSGRAYTVVLNFLKTSISTFAGIPVKLIRVHGGTGDGGMIINVHDLEDGGSFTLDFDFNCQLFHPDVRRPAIGHFTNLLTGFLQDPSTAICRARMLDEREREQLTVTWNDTAAQYRDDVCLPQLIEEQVQRTPEAIAMIFGDRQLSYQAMNARANAVARYLRSLEVKPEDVVAVCMQRGIDMPIAMLGIMKAGGAYLPLDPDYPAERLAFMLKDAGTGLLLTDSATHDKVFGGDQFSGVRFVCLDDDTAELSANNEPDLDPLAIGSNLAYVIYTSGSAGTPKGVMIEHRGLVNNINWQVKEFGFNASDRFLQWTSAIFDASIWELWTPLCVGASQVISDSYEARDPKATVHLIRRESITFAQAVPTFFSGMLTEMEQTTVPLLLRLFVVGGEALSTKDARRWTALCRAELVNIYGPTECTVDACFFRYPRDRACETMSIGSPIANTRVYILDACMQPVPVGVAGELYIAGDGVARGYLNRPQLTAERFVSNPFARQPGACLYRTGDLGRFQPDGNIEFLGRTDLQVKVRGYRIELGEIEVALAAHPQVRQCVVIAREDRPGDVRIVAYVVPEVQTPLMDAMREHLGAMLPVYMLPQHFVTIAAMPLLPNGKIDRKALAAPGDEDNGRTFVAPASSIEIALAEIWCEVLAVKRVGVTDNFFELGGHLLSATRVVSRIHSKWGVELPLRAIFEAPTLAGLSDLVAELRRAGSPSLVRRNVSVRVERGSSLPVSFSQRRMWLLQAL